MRLRLLLAMVGKDLRRRARSPLPTILLLLFPLLFAGMIALTFGGGEAKTPKVRLLIADEDDSLVGRLVTAAFSRGEAQTYFEVSVLPKTEKIAGDGSALLEEKAAAALLRLPAGLTNDLLDGRPARIELVKNPAQAILPDIAEQVSGILAEVLSAASRLLRGPLDQIRATRAGPEGAIDNQRVAEISVLVNGVVTRARPLLLPPAITLETATPPAPTAPSAPPFSLFLLFLPGVSVYALFNLADQSMRDLLVEARLKTLRRQLAGPVTAARVLAGKALSTAAVAALAILLLSAVGALVAPRPVSLAGYLLVSLALVVASTGFAAFVFGLAQNERQGAALVNLLSLVMAFAGGSFIQLAALPAALRAISPFSLMYWANQGYEKLVNEGLGLREVLPHIAVLAGAGLLLLALSAPLWRRRLLRGELA